MTNVKSSDDPDISPEAMSEQIIVVCEDCSRPYGDEHGFPDLVLPDDMWSKISTGGDENGMLCPSCICKRAHDAGIECLVTFRSGPFFEDRAVSDHTITVEQAAKVLLDAIGDDWSAAVNAMTPALRADVDPTGWNTVTEMREAFFAAIRALAQKDSADG